ncbi:MAG: GNAT family N-acetyltransferase [Dehalococcoidia bacterium]
MASGTVTADGPAAGFARPFRLGRDLGEVVRLIDHAFGPTSADERLTGRDVVLLRLFAPLVGVLGLVAPSARDLFAGVVWETRGRIVGNVTIGRLAGDQTRWMIGNVAVDPAFRRQGIARALTIAALAEIGRRGGKVTILDVRSDNEPAYALYRDLGFRRIDSIAEFRRRPSRERRVLPPGVRLLRAREWRAFWLLQCAATPAEVQAAAPIQEQQAIAAAVGAGIGIAGRAITGHQSTILVTEAAGNLTSAVEIELHGGETPHRVKLTILPQARGTVERLLVSAALAQAVRPVAPIRAEVRASETAAIAALGEAGFVPYRILDRLALGMIDDAE